MTLEPFHLIAYFTEEDMLCFCRRTCDAKLLLAAPGYGTSIEYEDVAHG